MQDKCSIIYAITDSTFFSTPDQLTQLENEDKIVIENDLIFQKSSSTNYYSKRMWTRTIFEKNKKYISLISKLPWIIFIGLTGANAFESCKKNDDVDMFVVTQKNRLWLTYTLIVIISKILRKRGVLCINYLVDQENLAINHQSYYNAVQLLQMKAIFNIEFYGQLIEANKWIFDFLPNATFEKTIDYYYQLTDKSKNLKVKNNSFLTKIDEMIYKKYSKHLKKKYMHLFGKSLVLHRGIAKLHRQDNHDVYMQLLEPVPEAIYYQ